MWCLKFFNEINFWSKNFFWSINTKMLCIKLLKIICHTWISQKWWWWKSKLTFWSTILYWPLWRKTFQTFWFVTVSTVKIFAGIRTWTTIIADLTTISWYDWNIKGVKLIAKVWSFIQKFDKLLVYFNVHSSLSSYLGLLCILMVGLGGYLHFHQRHNINLQHNFHNQSCWTDRNRRRMSHPPAWFLPLNKWIVK